MRDLGRAVVISKSGLTGLVDRTQRAGLVERGGDPGDRRVVHVTLTPAGAEAYRRARDDHRQAVADVFPAPHRRRRGHRDRARDAPDQGKRHVRASG
jgi:DNA-binding MarR family transcriptional regulator